MNFNNTLIHASSLDFDSFKCRCSSIGLIMSNSKDNPSITEKQTEELAELEKKEALTKKQKEKMAELLLKKENSKKVILSDSCVSYLMEWYAEKTAGKLPVDRETMDLDAISKGKLMEEDSLLLLSNVDGYYYEKNEERVSNEYLTGEPDTFVGEHIINAEAIIDTKSVWDYPTYLKQINAKLQPIYVSQIKGYGDICNTQELYVAKCLVNMPEEMIESYKTRMAYKLKLDVNDIGFLNYFDKLEQSMRFDDIEERLRVHKTKVEPFTILEKQQVYDRVLSCREWLFNFHEKYLLLNS